jgi:predicted nucleic acid-binding protein
MIELASQVETNLVILSLSRVELRAAVQRRVRSRDLSRQNADTALASFNEHLGTVYIVQQITEALIEKAQGLIDRHDLRAYDSIQLAACLTLPMHDSEDRAIFTCADSRLVAAAKEEGCPVLNPAA